MVKTILYIFLCSLQLAAYSRFMKKTTPNIVLLIFFCAFLVCGELKAQVPPPPAPGLPIDGGLMLLLISGVVLGVSKIKGGQN
jgi:hypothetical protein